MEQLQQQTFNMEQAAMTTENLRNTMATVDAMKTANKEMKKQYGKLDVDKIENLHYEMEDLMEAANEVQESMSRTYGVPEELDEADLQAGKYQTSSVWNTFSSECSTLLSLQNLMHWKTSWRSNQCQAMTKLYRRISETTSTSRSQTWSKRSQWR